MDRGDSRRPLTTIAAAVRVGQRTIASYNTPVGVHRPRQRQPRCALTHGRRELDKLPGAEGVQAQPHGGIQVEDDLHPRVVAQVEETRARQSAKAGIKSVPASSPVKPRGRKYRWARPRRCPRGASRRPAGRARVRANALRPVHEELDGRWHSGRDADIPVNLGRGENRSLGQRKRSERREGVSLRPRVAGGLQRDHFHREASGPVRMSSAPSIAFPRTWHQRR
jgi:hypothetical protein